MSKTKATLGNRLFFCWKILVFTVSLGFAYPNVFAEGLGEAEAGSDRKTLVS
jgi:hypothetical protein